MKYCKKCLYPENHALNIIFDDEGICSGCRVHEEKDYLDWNEREEKLIKILDNYRNKSQSNFDCVVPVSGGKDSYFIVDLIKNKYNMNPLLVSFNKTFNTKLGIRNLQYLKTIFGCDMIQSTVNPEVSKKIVRYTFEKFGNIYWLNHLGTTTFPVQIAQKFKIPLIIWGVHQGIDQVGMFSHMDEVEMTRKYRKEHDLFGIEALDLIDEKNGIFEKDLIKMAYPSNKEINEVGIRGIYLGNYIRWDSKSQHETMIQKYNYTTAEQTRTFIPYDNLDCFMYSDIHDYLKFIKHGYSKVNDHVSREIRLGHIDIEEGKQLIKFYQYIKPKNNEILLSWLNMTNNEYESILLSHYNLELFSDVNKPLKLKNQVDIELDLKIVQNVKNRYIKSKTSIFDNKILLFDKGWQG